jgi:hypothetical protein
VKCHVHISLASVLSVLAVIVAAGPQVKCQEVPTSSVQTVNGSTVRKPTRKPDQVITNDPIALLAPRTSATAAASDANAKEDGASGATESARKAAEIASTEQQIKDKQKRIVLLMRLFVDDERAFVNDPSNTQIDSAVAERRRYEQDELHWETAELARLKARLRELTASH